MSSKQQVKFSDKAPKDSVVEGSLDDSVHLAGNKINLAGASNKQSKEAQVESPDSQVIHDMAVEFSDSIYRLALSIVKDRALAEDVTQETLVKAWLALPSFRGEASLKSWVMKIAYNNSISAIRSRKTILMNPDDLPEEILDVSVERKVQNKAAMKDFIAALDLLDDLSRSIIILREVEQMSYDEIVEVLKVPMPTVKTRLLRARRRLSLALEGWM